MFARDSKAFVVATAALALFTDVFLGGLIVPVLPFLLQDRANAGPDQTQSSVSVLLSVYAGAQFLMSPVAGIISDRMQSRRYPFLIGLIGLLLSTILLFVARNLLTLVAARILQGASAGIVWTIGLVLCAETVGHENLGKTIGWIFGIISVGNFGAPILGGWIYKGAGLVGLLLVALALISVDFAMRFLMVERAPPRSSYASHSLMNDDVFDVELELSAGTHHRVHGSPTAKTYQPGFLQAIIFPASLVNARLLTASLIELVQGILLGSFNATVPITAEKYFQFDSFQVGLLFLPLCGCDLVLGPVWGSCVDRFGTRAVSTIAFGLLVPALVSLRIPDEGGTLQVVLYVILLAFCGIGLAGISTPSIVETSAVIESYHASNPAHFGDGGPSATIYSLNSMLFSFGMFVGPEIAGSATEMLGYGNMNALLAVLCGAMAMLSFCFLEG